MRNYWIIAWTALLGICTGRAQTIFTFEDGVPEGWTVTEGTLATTGKTYKAQPFPPFIQNIITKGGLLASLKEE